jgi:hypothetical protein
MRTTFFVNANAVKVERMGGANKALRKINGGKEVGRCTCRVITATI